MVGLGIAEGAGLGRSNDGRSVLAKCSLIVNIVAQIGLQLGKIVCQHVVVAADIFQLEVIPQHPFRITFALDTDAEVALLGQYNLRGDGVIRLFRRRIQRAEIDVGTFHGVGRETDLTIDDSSCVVRPITSGRWEHRSVAMGFFCVTIQGVSTGFVCNELQAFLRDTTIELGGASCTVHAVEGGATQAIDTRSSSRNHLIEVEGLVIDFGGTKTIVHRCRSFQIPTCAVGVEGGIG